MHAYSEVYLKDVIETQGKLFDFVAYAYPDKSTEDFIVFYMNCDTRKAIDDSQAYLNTMNYKELWNYFIENEKYEFKSGKALSGFMPDWIGEFYAYYQWYYNMSSSEVIKKIPVGFLEKSYYGLHDLELDLAVKKVGNTK